MSAEALVTPERGQRDPKIKIKSIVQWVRILNRTWST